MSAPGDKPDDPQMPAANILNFRCDLMNGMYPSFLFIVVYVILYIHSAKIFPPRYSLNDLFVPIIRRCPSCSNGKKFMGTAQKNNHHASGTFVCYRNYDDAHSADIVSHNVERISTRRIHKIFQRAHQR